MSPWIAWGDGVERDGSYYFRGHIAGQPTEEFRAYLHKELHPQIQKWLDTNCPDGNYNYFRNDYSDTFWLLLRDYDAATLFKLTFL